MRMHVYAAWIRPLKNGGDPFLFQNILIKSSLNLLPEIKSNALEGE